MSAPRIGLLVVHGIGQQLAGDLCREIASALADEKSAPALRLPASAASNAAQLGQVTDRGLLAHVTVGDVPVIVAEANWADLSSPDDPPAVRSVIPVVSDLLETIRAAWRNSHAAAILRRLDRRHHHLGSIGIVAVVLVVLASLIASALTRDEFVMPEMVTIPVGILWIGLAVHLVTRSVRYRWLRSRRASRLRRVLEAVLWGIVSYLLGMLLVAFLPLFGASMLFYFAIAVAITGLFVFATGIVARLFVQAAAVMARVHALSARTWIHRFGSVMVVLPSHVLLEAVRSAGNLFSVMFTERTWTPRLAAFGGLFGVYAAFLLLILVCEMLLMPAVVLAIFTLEEELTAGTAVALGIVVTAMFLRLYMLFLKLILPAIDLLLDIAKYHLADDAERQSYHERIERAVFALREAGCREIHILAHSLGTVLVYDWLKSTRPGSYPIAVLHTIGSPLDKFWYIDHGVLRRRADRDGLRAHVSRGWTNFWAPADPVSGALDHYDGPRMPVVNEKLQGLGPFLVSHVRYWQNQTVLEAVRKGITAGGLGTRLGSR